MTAAKLGDEEWELFEAISETYALPGSPSYMDPEAFNRFLRSRMPARGKRFAHDHRDTCAYIERSKNANVVAYTVNYIVPAGSPEATKAFAPPPNSSTSEGAEKVYCLAHYHHSDPAAVAERTRQLDPGWVPVPSGMGITCQVNPQNPIHPYFVRLEPSYIEARRKKGIQGDCDELTMLERKFAFGYNNKFLAVESHIRVEYPSHAKKGGRLFSLLCEGGGRTREATLQSLVDWWGKLPPLSMSFVPLPAWPMFGFLLKPLRRPSGLSPTNGEAPQTNASSWCSDEDTISVLLAIIDKKICILSKVYVKSIERWFGLPSAEYIEVFGTTLEDGASVKERRDKDNRYVHPGGAE